MPARTITVEGMSCDHCERTVEEALESVASVESATADRDTESVTVEGTADVDGRDEVVDDAGYDASA